MRYIWLLFVVPIALGIIIALFAYSIRTRKKDRDISKMSVIAHTKAIKELPAYKAAKRRYNILLAAAAVCFIVALFSTTVLAARPTRAELSKSRAETRDVILCLDVSGSLKSSQEALLKYYKTLIDGFNGERIGITIFDGRPVNLVPLTDDYTALYEVLGELGGDDESGSGGIRVYANSLAMDGNSSQIGMGLVGCVNSFDNLGDSKRPQSIILATDNNSTQNEISITQAANYAKRYGITVYGIKAGTVGKEQDFNRAIAATGGIYYTMNDDIEASARSIIDKISAQEAAIYEGAHEYIFTDAPELPLTIAAISIVLFIAIVWRLRL